MSYSILGITFCILGGMFLIHSILMVDAKFAKYFLCFAGIADIVIGTFLIFNSSAEAAPKVQTICVKESLNGNMDVDLKRAMHFVDQYTGSRMVRSTSCSKYDGTLYISVGKVPQVSPGGRTFAYHKGNRILLDPRTPRYARVRLLEHELGHHFGLNHTNDCNIMKAIIVCHGKLVPERFTNAQKAILRTH